MQSMSLAGIFNVRKDASISSQRLSRNQAVALGRQDAYNPRVRSIWKRIRYRLEWAGLLTAAKLVPLLSRKGCYRLALALGELMSILDQHGRKVALSNLEVAFGDRFSLGERERIARESFQHFARTMLDLLWSPRLTAENFSRYIELETLEETARYGSERSIMIACYHY